MEMTVVVVLENSCDSVNVMVEDGCGTVCSGMLWSSKN